MTIARRAGSGINFQAIVVQVDEPVNRNSGGRIEGGLVRESMSIGGVGDLDDERGVLGGSAAAGVVTRSTADDGGVRFRLAVALVRSRLGYPWRQRIQQVSGV